MNEMGFNTLRLYGKQVDGGIEVQMWAHGRTYTEDAKLTGNETCALGTTIISLRTWHKLIKTNQMSIYAESQYPDEIGKGEDK